MGTSLPFLRRFVEWMLSGKNRATAVARRLRTEQSALHSGRGGMQLDGSYLSFTNSRTKIAHTPTVKGNCTRAESRSVPPRGSRKVSKYIATAVIIPRTSLLFQFMIVSPSITYSRGCSVCRHFARAKRQPVLRGTRQENTLGGLDRGLTVTRHARQTLRSQPGPRA